MDRPEISFDGKIYVYRKHRQLLIPKKKYDTSKETDTHISLAHDVMLTQISSKKGIKQFGEQSVADIFKEYQQINDGKMPGKIAFDQFIMRN